MNVIAPKVKVKYLTNKEFLLELQKSKASYSYFVSPEYAVYTEIVSSVDELTNDFLNAVILKKASKMSTKLNVIDPESIDPESIVFRVMTDEHLPLETDEKRRKKSSKGEWVTKPNFSPYKHYIIKDGQPVEVGRSHWKESLHNGSFDLHHGKMTNRLAQMFMLLVENISHKGNWRGYCVDELTEALTQRGWLTQAEITTDDMILSYDIDTEQLKWSKIKSIFRDNYDGNMFKMTVTGLDALVTPGHKFVTKTYGLKEVEYLLETDNLILMGNAVDTKEQKYSDAFVELVGWIVTEGNFYLREESNFERITIYQNEGVNADRIRKCLNSLDARYSEYIREREATNYPSVAFSLTKQICEQIEKVVNKKSLTMEFILSLSSSQRKLLIETMVTADGWIRTQHGIKNFSYCQKDKEHMDMFLALCTISGYRVSCRKRDIVSSVNKIPSHIYEANVFSRNNPRVENIDFHGAKRTGKENGTVGKGKINHPNEPTVYYRGTVWCPETEYGTFVARRNGTIYLTSNTYVDEMRNQALMHLSQVGLQFDESRSDNPFAFYTQIIKHCFTRILNLEKRHQSIRDDILIMNGAQPSYTRQVDNETDQRDDTSHKGAYTPAMSDLHVVAAGNNSDPESNLIKKEAKKRGRKPKTK